MSAQILQARKNRIVALRTVAARNADPLHAEHDPVPTFRSHNTAPLSVVGNLTQSPWQPEGNLAA